jgi:hypothetical protein
MKVKAATLLALLATVLMLAGCDAIAGKPSILGSWEADDTPGYTLEFRSDGTVMMTQDGATSQTLDFAVDQSTSPITLNIDGETGSAVFTDEDHLTITDSHGALSLHRLK